VPATPLAKSKPVESGATSLKLEVAAGIRTRKKPLAMEEAVVKVMTC